MFISIVSTFNDEAQMKCVLPMELIKLLFYFSIIKQNPEKLLKVNRLKE